MKQKNWTNLSYESKDRAKRLRILPENGSKGYLMWTIEGEELILEHMFVYKSCSAWKDLQNESIRDSLGQNWFFHRAATGAQTPAANFAVGGGGLNIIRSENFLTMLLGHMGDELD